MKPNILKAIRRNKVLLLIFLFVLSAFFVIRYFLWYRSTSTTEIVYIAAKTHSEILPIYDSLVPPVSYTEIPDLTELDTKQRKQKFIEILLPSILLFKEEVAAHEKRLEDIQLVLRHENQLKIEDSLFLARMMETLKADDLDVLKEKIKAHPPSIVLAQAIIESGWGTSRFFREANNIFGMWSFSENEDRIPASMSRAGKKVFVRKYPDIYSAIQDYYFTLGRAPAYRSFRKARLKEEDPMVLVSFLQQYSELRLAYVEKLRGIMRQNNLQQYDSYRLDWDYFNKVRSPKATKLTEGEIKDTTEANEEISSE
ncbi:MAG: glucosaminidase domain-containing protein [Cyclobacteriaceae bacterium]|nr:glucosaminidase domain-containing protein [Cyclobacteriaceae bacterium]